MTGAVSNRAEQDNALHSTLGQLLCGLADHRLTSIVFAKLIEESLSSADPGKSLPADTYNRIETAVLIRSVAATVRRADLDKQGTRIWNLSSELRNTSKDGKPLCLGKESSSECIHSC